MSHWPLVTGLVTIRENTHSFIWRLSFSGRTGKVCSFTAAPLLESEIHKSCR